MKKRPPRITFGPHGNSTPQNRSEQTMSSNLLSSAKTMRFLNSTTMSETGPVPATAPKTKKNLNLTTLSEGGVVLSETKTCQARYEKIELDLAYNQYLQNLLKQHIVDVKRKENKKVLSDQIEEHRKEESEMKAKLLAVKQSVERAQELQDIQQSLKEAEKIIEEFHKIHDEYEGKSSLEKFLSMLNIHCRHISGIVKQPDIKSKRDCEKIIDMFKALSLCIVKALNCNSDFDEVRDLGQCIEEFLPISQQIIDRHKFLNDYYDKLLFKKIGNISDLFAKQYEHSNV